jgi:hypothetical protein
MELLTNEIVELQAFARKGLEENVVTWKNREYLTAGQHQFKSIWVRDFGHCAIALASIGRQDIIFNHLELYLGYVRNGFGPKGFDTRSIEGRVIETSVRQLLGFKKKSLLFNKDAPLRPVYQDSRGACAVDSNLMMLLAIFSCNEKDKDSLLSGDNLTKVKSMFFYYNSLKNDDEIIAQTAHSDWQDSQKRVGPIFLTNLLYYRVAELFIESNIPLLSPDALNLLYDNINTYFYDATLQLFRTGVNSEQFSIDGNLLAIRFGFVKGKNAVDLYHSLKQHDLWLGTPTSNSFSRTDCFCCFNQIEPSEMTGFPGFATWPDYPKSSAAFQVRLAGLQSYHDSLYWSWLMALSGEIAYRCGDMIEGDRIVKNLLILARRDNGFAEVYAHRKAFPMFRTLLYTSEVPFSWGAAYVLNMIDVRSR